MTALPTELLYSHDAAFVVLYRGLITAAWTVGLLFICPKENISNLRQLMPNTAKLNWLSQTVIKNKTVATPHAESTPLTLTEHYELHSISVYCRATVLWDVLLLHVYCFSPHLCRRLPGDRSIAWGRFMGSTAVVMVTILLPFSPSASSRLLCVRASPVGDKQTSQHKTRMKWRVMHTICSLYRNQQSKFKVCSLWRSKFCFKDCSNTVN